MEKNSEAKHVQKNHFVLVHGAGHGAWCWYKVALILQSDGHEVTALVLAASGVNPTRMEQLVSLEDYVRPLMESLEGLSGDQRGILLGHSLGGCVISIAMERVPGEDIGGRVRDRLYAEYRDRLDGHDRIVRRSCSYDRALQRSMISWIQRILPRKKIVLVLSTGDSISWQPSYVNIVLPRPSTAVV